MKNRRSLVILRFEPELKPTGLSAVEELAQAGERLSTSNPGVFQVARELYDKGGFGELVMIAGERAYIAEPDGSMLEFPDFDLLAARG
jgi:hypothetical protein